MAWCCANCANDCSSFRNDGFSADRWQQFARIRGLPPAKTPATTIVKLNQAVLKALGTAQIRESFDNFGIEATGSSPEQFASTMKKDFEYWGRIVKASGFKIDN